MYRFQPFARCIHHRKGLSRNNGFSERLSVLVWPPQGNARRFGSRASKDVPHIDAPRLDSAKQARHVQHVDHQLRETGILKVKLHFSDPSSRYLEQLLMSLHQHHGHQLPISHSAHRDWFWDVQPRTTNFQSGDNRARSESMGDFPWHTDCSYEERPPRYFALHVLQHDRYGGGTLSVKNVASLVERLSPSTRSALACPEYRISVPREFVKDPDRRCILGCILTANKGSAPASIRFRGDILSAMSKRASKALEELKRALRDMPDDQSGSTLHFPPEELPSGSIVLINNRRWLHARNNVRDPERHLRRVRWDAVPFE